MKIRRIDIPDKMVPDILESYKTGIYAYLYGDATLYLDRKYNRFQHMLVPR